MLSRIRRWLNNVSGFTDRHRAGVSRRGVVLGKTAMFFNDFPRFGKVNAKRSVLNSLVRAEFFEGFQFFVEIFACRR